MNIRIYVINMMNTHWVACYTKKEVTYFDSFGVANILKKILKIIAVFSIWKSLRVSKKACIKILAHAIYSYRFFPFTYILLFCCKIKDRCDRCFPQQTRPQTTIQLYILQDYFCVGIGFSMNSKCHTLPIVYTMLV